MKKLLMLIPASLFLTMSMAQNTNSAVSPKTSSLDGKSFKITLTNLGNENMNSRPKDNTQMNPDRKSGDMGVQDKAPMDKTTGKDQAQTGNDKTVTAKTATLKFKGGMLKSSFTGMLKAKDCGYTTTSSASSASATDAISFTSVCSTDENTGSNKSSGNTGDKASQSSGDMNAPGSSGTTVTTSNSSGTGANTQSTTTTMSTTASRVEWTGTVSGNTINGTLKVTENGQYTNYSFTGTMMDMSGQLGMEE